MADITDEFSFAYLKEAFIATLLELARNHQDDDEDSLEDDDDEDPLDKYEFWRAFKEQVKILRSEMSDSANVGSDAGATSGTSSEHAEIVSLLDAIRFQGSMQVGKAALPLAMGELESADSRARFVQNSSALSDNPIIRNFAPLAQTKNAKLNEGVWEWGV